MQQNGWDSAHRQTPPLSITMADRAPQLPHDVKNDTLLLREGTRAGGLSSTNQEAGLSVLPVQLRNTSEVKALGARGP